MTGPLQGVRVLDVTHVMAGSFCTMLLADMGADVVKVERPGTGDETRGFGGSSAFQPFVAVNRNKRALALDLGDPRGADILRRLAGQADVFVENFRPGAMSRLGLGYEDLRTSHPSLIYCSISGFGATGPYRERGGFDLVAQGMSGITSFTGQPGGPPVKGPSCRRKTPRPGSSACWRPGCRPLHDQASSRTVLPGTAPDVAKDTPERLLRQHPGWVTI